MAASLLQMIPDAVKESAPQLLPSFARVYQEYFGFVWRNALSLGVRASALDDVTQEVFVIVHRRLGEFEGRSSFRTWLSGIVLNVVRHHRRSLARKSPHELEREETKDPDELLSGASRSSG